MYQLYLILLIFNSAVVTVGFAFDEYNVNEPSFSARDEQVCVRVISGSLGTSLTLQPAWTATTATGKPHMVLAC